MDLVHTVPLELMRPALAVFMICIHKITGCIKFVVVRKLEQFLRLYSCDKKHLENN